MGYRVTIVLEPRNRDYLRSLQSKMQLNNPEKSISFSQVLNQVLDAGRKR